MTAWPRNLLLPVLLFCTASSSLLAQREHSEAFQKGIVLGDLHTSLGLYRNKNFQTSRAPLFAGADYGISNMLGFGIFGGWSQRTYKPPGSLPFDVNYYYYGGRFSLHLTDVLGKNTILRFNTRTVDIYATFWAGRESSKQLTFTGGGSISTGTVNRFGFYAGVRMFTMYRVGILVEAGAGPYGVLNIGICTRI